MEGGQGLPCRPRAERGVGLTQGWRKELLGLFLLLLSGDGFLSLCSSAFFAAFCPPFTFKGMQNKYGYRSYPREW